MLAQFLHDMIETSRLIRRPCTCRTISFQWVSIDVETCLGVVYPLHVDTLRIDSDSLREDGPVRRQFPANFGLAGRALGYCEQRSKSERGLHSLFQSDVL